MKIICPRCGSGSLVGAKFVYSDIIFKDKIKCLSCGRFFEYEQFNGIKQWPDREEKLPYLINDD